MRIIITVDTEADDQWNRQGPISIENVFALSRFQTLCEKYEMPPTYLLTYEVAADARAAAQFREWQGRGAEIGSHLHPWTTPPLSADDATKERFPSELSDAELRAKFSNLNEAVKNTIGKQPTSYRAGRWGFDDRQARLLQEFGHVVDLSVTPGISWADKGGPDFIKESVIPRQLNDAVLEVPMTIVRSGFLWRLTWLRIFENTTLKRLQSVIHAARQKQLPVVVCMIHSSELMAGKSPYVKTKEALEHVYHCLEGLFDLCAGERIEGVAASAFARMCVESGDQISP